MLVIINSVPVTIYDKFTSLWGMEALKGTKIIMECCANKYYIKRKGVMGKISTLCTKVKSCLAATLDSKRQC